MVKVRYQGAWVLQLTPRVLWYLSLVYLSLETAPLEAAALLQADLLPPANGPVTKWVPAKELEQPPETVILLESENPPFENEALQVLAFAICIDDMPCITRRVMSAMTAPIGKTNFRILRWNKTSIKVYCKIILNNRLYHNKLISAGYILISCWIMGRSLTPYTVYTVS